MSHTIAAWKYLNVILKKNLSNSKIFIQMKIWMNIIEYNMLHMDFNIHNNYIFCWWDDSLRKCNQSQSLQQFFSL